MATASEYTITIAAIMLVPAMVFMARRLRFHRWNQFLMALAAGVSAAVIATLVWLTVFPKPALAQHAPLPVKSAASALAQNLIGRWVLIGQPDQVTAMSKAGGRFKTITDKGWSVSQFDVASGAVTVSHGGTYTLDGDVYAETVTYASDTTRNLKNETFKFTLKLKGDRLTQTGIGNPWNRVWMRVKENELETP